MNFPMKKPLASIDLNDQKFGHLLSSTLILNINLINEKSSANLHEETPFAEKFGVCEIRRN